MPAGAFIRYTMVIHSRLVTVIAILALIAATVIVLACVALTAYGWITRATQRVAPTVWRLAQFD